VIALPLLARLNVRKKDLIGIDAKHRPTFRTKLELGAELLALAAKWLKPLGKPLWERLGRVAPGIFPGAPTDPDRQSRILIWSHLLESTAVRLLSGWQHCSS
jgi:hypothetical protein